MNSKTQEQVNLNVNNYSPAPSARMVRWEGIQINPQHLYTPEVYGINEKREHV